MYNNSNSELPPTAIPVIPPPARPRRGPGRWLIYSVLLLVVGLSSGLVIQNQVRQGAFATPSAVIRITSEGFSPGSVTIKAGQSVEWQNDDQVEHHLATNPAVSKQLKVFSEEPLQPGKSLKLKFDAPGEYLYHDPGSETKFQATVIVR